jgi:hypothetical protein
VTTDTKKLIATTSVVILFGVGIALAIWQWWPHRTDLELMLIWIAAGGAIGGLANGLYGYDGLILPQRVQLPIKLIGENLNQAEVKATIFQLGFIGNLIMGAISGFAVLGISTQLKDTILIGPGPAGTAAVLFTVGQLAASVIAGFGGAKAIAATNENKLLRSITATSAADGPNQALAAAAPFARPLELTRLATTTVATPSSHL